MVTIQQDLMGNYHIWRRHGKPRRVDKYLYHVKNKEADIFIQDKLSIDELECRLEKFQVSELNNGYHVITDIIRVNQDNQIE